jgi:hypothetical protein
MAPKRLVMVYRTVKQLPFPTLPYGVTLLSQTQCIHCQKKGSGSASASNRKLNPDLHTDPHQGDKSQRTKKNNNVDQ